MDERLTVPNINIPVPTFSHDTVVGGIAELGDVTINPDDGDILMYTGDSNSHVSPSWTSMPDLINPNREAFEDMKIFKEFLIMKGIISNEEFERYKEDRAKIDNIN